MSVENVKAFFKRLEKDEATGGPFSLCLDIALTNI